MKRTSHFITAIFIGFINLVLSSSACGQAKLAQIKGFGSNPGELSMWFYQPAEAKGKLPLVVALHGCSQRSGNFAKETGWLDLAVMHEFGLLVPEQEISNNPTFCFNWFNKEDQQGDNGELASIIQMIDFALENGPFDPAQVYVYGVSAGGAMTMALMANHPSYFEAGACLGGVPYGSAEKMSDLVNTTTAVKERSQESWVSEIKSLNPEYRESYPKLIVMHGATDNTVNPGYARANVLAWTGLHSCMPAPQSQMPMLPHTDLNLHTYVDPNGDWQVKYYEILDSGHIIPINPGTGTDQGGKPGMFTKKMSFFSTYLIAKDFGLIN